MYPRCDCGGSMCILKEIGLMGEVDHYKIFKCNRCEIGIEKYLYPLNSGRNKYEAAITIPPSSWQYIKVTPPNYSDFTLRKDYYKAHKKFLKEYGANPNTIPFHRWVWQEYHHKFAYSRIHHLNGIKGDNRPRNLYAMKNGVHNYKLHPNSLVAINQRLKLRIRELEGQLSQIPYWDKPVTQEGHKTKEERERGIGNELH